MPTERTLCKQEKSNNEENYLTSYTLIRTTYWIGVERCMLYSILTWCFPLIKQILSNSALGQNNHRSCIYHNHTQGSVGFCPGTLTDTTMVDVWQLSLLGMKVACLYMKPGMEEMR